MSYSLCFSILNLVSITTAMQSDHDDDPTNSF